MGKIPSLTELLALFSGLVAAALALFVKLWLNARGRAHEAQRREEAAKATIQHGRETRKAAAEERKRTEDKVREVEKDVEDGRTDHFSSDR